MKTFACRYSLMLLLLMIYAAANAQGDSIQVADSKRLWRFGAEGSYAWQYTNSLDIVYNIMSYNNTNRESKNSVTPCFGFGIGADMHYVRGAFPNSRLTINPRARIDYYTKFVRGGLDLTLFLRERKTDLRLTPELGYVWKNMFSLNYGYNVPLGSNEFSQVGRHKVSLNINITIARFMLIEKREGFAGGAKRFFKRS